MATFTAHGEEDGANADRLRETVTNDRSWWVEGVIHIQFPPPSVTLSAFVVGEMDHLQTHSPSFFIPHTDTHTDSLSVTNLFVLAA